MTVKVEQEVEVEKGALEVKAEKGVLEVKAVKGAQVVPSQTILTVCACVLIPTWTVGEGATGASMSSLEMKSLLNQSHKA